MTRRVRPIAHLDLRMSRKMTTGIPPYFTLHWSRSELLQRVAIYKMLL